MKRFLVTFCILAIRALAEDAIVPFAALPQQADGERNRAKSELGRLLFFDPILSATETVSCSTCHQPAKGWTDGRETALGIEPLTRNTLTILNAGFNTDGVMFWDNREVGLKAQVRHPILAKEEMRGDACREREAAGLATRRVRAVPEYQRQFRDVFGGEATFERIADAIATFERSLVTSDTAFDRFMRGDKSALSARQQNGMKLFERAGCNRCHGGAMLSDFKLHVVGAPGERQAFRTPSLRNLRHTAPYMHNGRLRRLDEVLDFYDELMDEVGETLDGGDTSAQPPLDPLLRHLNIDEADFEDMKAFLDSLNADSYDQTEPQLPRRENHRVHASLRKN